MHVTRVGVVGGGQLARMLAEAASPLGVRLRVLATAGEEAVADVVADVVADDSGAAAGGAAAGIERLEAFAAGCDVVTFEHEHVPPAVVEELLARGHVVRPGARALELTDKVVARHAVAGAGLPVPPFRVVRSVAEVAAFAAERAQWPLVLKSPTGGYDGRGVWTVTGPREAEAVFARAGAEALLAEPHLPLERELAVVVARRPSGEAVAYPVVETVQSDGICREVTAPAGVPAALADRAQRLAVAVAELAEAVGVLAVELFVVGGELLVNELAPRPHNSGHLTIEACPTSQFEQHLRAVLDWPLGPVALRSPAAMVNVIAGEPAADPRERVGEALAAGDAHVHLYGKSPRPGRKLGHVTALGASVPAALAAARPVADVLARPAVPDAGGVHALSGGRA